MMNHTTTSSLFFICAALACVTLPCAALSYKALPCAALPREVLPYTTSSGEVSACEVLPLPAAPQVPVPLLSQRVSNKDRKSLVSFILGVLHGVVVQETSSKEYPTNLLCNVVFLGLTDALVAPKENKEIYETLLYHGVGQFCGEFVSHIYSLNSLSGELKRPIGFNWCLLCSVYYRVMRFFSKN